ncbi:hypothetical protein ACFLR3_03070 [Campylobacterota bacterium]
MRFNTFKKLLLSMLFFSLVIFLSITSFEIYKQNRIIKTLVEEGLDGRLIPHKVNHLSKLNAVLENGIKTFEVDLNFYVKDGKKYFEIGHDKEDSEGLNFESYLKITQEQKITKIWMDVKNISKDNIEDILCRLNYLDKHYNIKKRVIFETPSEIKEISKISDAGYHTSYYLPYSLSFPMAQDNLNVIKYQIKNVQKIIATQHIKALSFDSDVYPFVKKNLEPNISKKIVFHTWTGYRLREDKALKKLLEENYYKDPRVKTVIYPYYHPFLHNVIQAFL